MPRYFFNVYNDDVTIDDEGTICVDNDAARELAIKAVREIVCENIRTTGSFTASHRIVVQNSQKDEVTNVSFGEVVLVR